MTRQPHCPLLRYRSHVRIHPLEGIRNTRCSSSSTCRSSLHEHTAARRNALGLYSSIQEWDPGIHRLLELETQRQKFSLELIASENFVSPSVLTCLGSVLTNKYAEGRPGKRYYGGVEVVDKVERLAESRALEAFRLSPEEWSVNVQPYSGSPANLAVYMAVLGAADVPGVNVSSTTTGEDSELLSPADGSDNIRVPPQGTRGGLMGLHLSCGGHLTHGFFTPTRKVSASALFFQSVPYYTHPQTGYIDYDRMRDLALQHRPKLLIAGGSAYPRDWDYQRFRAVCDELNAHHMQTPRVLEDEMGKTAVRRDRKTLLMVDMAHTAGLIAAKEQNNPFLYADIVTTTTHKTLRGPRAGIVFSRKINLYDPVMPRGLIYCGEAHEGRKKKDSNKEKNAEWLPDLIHRAIFPGLQGGPHLNQIAAIATQLKAVCSPEWKVYAREVKNSAQFLAKALQTKGEKLVTGGTDNHLLLWDLRPHLFNSSPLNRGKAGPPPVGERSAAMVEQCLEVLNISANRNSVPGDLAKPSGIRLGTAALTTRGVTKEKEWKYVSELLLRGLELSKALVPPPSLSPSGRKRGLGRKAYMMWLKDQEEVKALREEVARFASSFPLPGE